MWVDINHYFFKNNANIYVSAIFIYYIYTSILLVQYTKYIIIYDNYYI